MSRFDDSDEQRLGEWAEREVVKVLKRRDWNVVASYEYTGPDGDKAPKMYGERSSLILPDLDVCRNGTRFWIEVKGKKDQSQGDHGIDKRLWEHYVQVQRQSGTQVWLFVAEVKTGEILCQSLDQLGAPRFNQFHNGTWMAFFRRSTFSHLGFVAVESIKLLPLRYQQVAMPQRVLL